MRIILENPATLSKKHWRQKKIITNKLDSTYLAVNEVRNYYLTLFFSVSALWTSSGLSEHRVGTLGFFPHLLLVDTYPSLVKSVWADRAPHIGLSPFDLNMFRQAWLRAKTSDDTKLHWGDAISIEVGQTLLLKKLCTMEAKPFTILYDIFLQELWKFLVRFKAKIRKEPSS